MAVPPYSAAERGDGLLVTPVAADRHREHDRQVHPGGPVLRQPRGELAAPPARHEPVGHLLRHQAGRARPVAGQHELAHAAQFTPPSSSPNSRGAAGCST